MLIFRHIQLIIFLITVLPVSAQVMNERQANNSQDLFEPQLSGEVYYPDYTAAGSPYFFEEWLIGDVWLMDGYLVKNKRLRYDGVADELYWLTDNTSLSVRVDKGLVSAFVLHRDQHGTSYHFQKLRIKDVLSANEKMVFTQVLYEGGLSLYVQRKVVETAANTTVIINDIPRTRALLGEEPLYFLKISGHEPVKINKSKRSLLSIFPDKKKEIAAAFRKNKAYFRNDYDLIRAVGIIDSLE